MYKLNCVMFVLCVAYSIFGLFFAISMFTQSNYTLGVIVSVISMFVWGYMAKVKFNDMKKSSKKGRL